jgi:hypothetical protein
MMGDLKNPRLMSLKAALFVLLGTLACIGLLLEAPSLRVALFLAVAIWSFARAYYFAFYVIEHYIDPNFRYAGLWSFTTTFVAPHVLSKRSFRRDRETSTGV